jgi:DUF971 family protein
MANVYERSDQPLGSQHWPTDIQYDSATKTLTIDWDDGARFTYPAELLRVESPSAEVQGHNPEQKQIVAGRMYVGIMGIEPVGNYAIRIKFDDMHETGIYSWPYLRTLGEKQDEIWRNYLDALSEKGLSRDPRAR